MFGVLQSRAEPELSLHSLPSLPRGTKRSQGLNHWKLRYPGSVLSTLTLSSLSATSNEEVVVIFLALTVLRRNEDTKEMCLDGPALLLQATSHNKWAPLTRSFPALSLPAPFCFTGHFAVLSIPCPFLCPLSSPFCLLFSLESLSPSLEDRRQSEVGREEKEQGAWREGDFCLSHVRICHSPLLITKDIS